MTVLLLRLKLTAVIYTTTSVSNNQVKRAYTGYSFRVNLRGMNIVLSFYLLLQYILVEHEILKIDNTINFIDLHFNIT